MKSVPPHMRKYRPCLCWSATCRYCAGEEHCTWGGSTNLPATDEEMAERWGVTVEYVLAQREALILSSPWKDTQ